MKILFFVVLPLLLIWVLFQNLKKTQPSIKKPEQEISLDMQSLNEEILVPELLVEGSIPFWLKGTLIRNGPAKWDVGTKRIEHWFDGLAMLHAFTFQEGKVSYANKFLHSHAYKDVEEGKIPYGSFASDPCRSIFKRVITFFSSEPEDEIHNANINVANLADKYVALYETPLPVEFDPKTLDTLGVLNYQDELPKGKCWESAHPHYDPENKVTINYLIKYGRESEYIFYQIKDGESTREILATIQVEQPAYMHSFSVTPQYIIISEYPFVVSLLNFLKGNKAFIKNFEWIPERGTHFTIINRKTGSIVKTAKTSALFSFHHINAFELNDKINLDLIAYDDVSIIFDLNSYKTAEDGTPLPQMRIMRYEISLENSEIKETLLATIEAELPRINPGFDGKPYQYVYSADVRSPIDQKIDIRNISKLDAKTKEVNNWSEKGCYPGEPVFVATPESKSEEDGVVLSVVLDVNSRRSFVVVLDAKTMKELGRASVPHHIPSGLHGQFYESLSNIK